MKLRSKRILSGIMIAGDLFMMLIGLILIFEEDMFIFGLIMLGLLVIDIYLTIDYIRSLSHREKVEESLKYDNLRASEIRQRYDELSAPERRTYRPHSVPRRAKGESIREEEDLSDVLSRREANQTGTARR
ncbi:MAG: hypothetical protein IJ201_04605 [Solobacterium sp.]|jgi:hypothetical protein|nr:hypothetical protein [Solobacterium sp.]MBQ8067613.1 hypothetical protein [Solobacterium sp.]